MSKTRNDALDINNVRYFLTVFSFPAKRPLTNTFFKAPGYINITLRCV